MLVTITNLGFLALVISLMITTLLKDETQPPYGKNDKTFTEILAFLYLFLFILLGILELYLLMQIR